LCLIFVYIKVVNNLPPAINIYQVMPELLAEVRAGLRINYLTLLSGFN